MIPLLSAIAANLFFEAPCGHRVFCGDGFFVATRKGAVTSILCADGRYLRNLNDTFTTVHKNYLATCFNATEELVASAQVPDVPNQPRDNIDIVGLQVWFAKWNRQKARKPITATVRGSPAALATTPDVTVHCGGLFNISGTHVSSRRGFSKDEMAPYLPAMCLSWLDFGDVPISVSGSYNNEASCFFGFGKGEERIGFTANFTFLVSLYHWEAGIISAQLVRMGTTCGADFEVVGNPRIQASSLLGICEAIQRDKLTGYSLLEECPLIFL